VRAAVVSDLALVDKATKCSYLQSVELDIGVTMRQALDQAGDALFWPVIRIGIDSVTDLHDGAPIL
jgi:hypothetical protein